MARLAALVASANPSNLEISGKYSSAHMTKEVEQATRSVVKHMGLRLLVLLKKKNVCIFFYNGIENNKAMQNKEKQLRNIIGNYCNAKPNQTKQNTTNQQKQKQNKAKQNEKENQSIYLLSLLYKHKQTKLNNKNKDIHLLPRR